MLVINNACNDNKKFIHQHSKFFHMFYPALTELYYH